MRRQLKAQLSKVKFLLGNNPKVEKTINYKKYIPANKKAVITITADFELAWAWRYSKSVKNPLERAQKKGDIERENIPKILGLSNKFEIPITWATVGHLFLKECSRENGKPHPNLPRLPHFENKHWRYKGSDWFEYDPCSSYKEAPGWYCPDLISQILNSKVGHEIGCHTFSHIDCRDGVCHPSIFEAEIKECITEASKLNVELKSFVHPGHTIGNLEKLVELGFSSYQTDIENILGYPVKHQNGLWELKRTYEFTYRKEWSINYHIYRYKKIIDKALSTNTVCNFWFHPSFSSQFLDRILPEVFQHINTIRKKILLTTVSPYIDWLNNGVK